MRKQVCLSINQFVSLQKLVPSGCSTLSNQTVTSSKDRFAIAGDSQVYIYNSSTFNLEKILPFCDHTVTHIQFHPQLSNVIACVTILPQLEIWNIDKGTVIYVQKLENRILQFEWNPLDPNILLFIFQNNLMVDDLKILNTTTKKFTSILPTYVEASCARWHPRKPNQLIAGCTDGTIYFCKIDTNQYIKSQNDHNMEIIDIQWNPGEDLVAVVFKDGNMRLYQQDNQLPQVKFEKQPQGISSVVWLDNVSGDIITTTSKVGALRIWNAVNEAPKDMLKVGPHGIQSIVPCKHKNGVFLLNFKSGAVVLYNVKKRKILFQTEVAHTSQVQKVKINPNNSKQMASVGFDGTIRIWNLNTMSVIQVIEDKTSKAANDNQINSLSWQTEQSKSKEDILCIVTSAGILKILDVKKNKFILKQNVSFGYSIFDVDWGAYGIILGGEDKKAYFYKFEDGALEELHNHQFQDIIRSVAWNHVKSHIAAVGLFNGKIYILDADKYLITQELTGCTDKVLTLQWHPHFDYILASGSNDTTLKVWDIKNTGHKTLNFHKAGVRTVQWNTEIPWLLMSGGDDSYIAAWDIRSNQLVFDHQEPSISISSFATHPKNPFMIVSSHLDNSVIFWDLLGIQDIFQVQLKFLLDMSLLDILCDPHDQMQTNTKGKLSGEQSKNLQMQNKKLSQSEKLLKYLSFFNQQDGDLELFNMLSIMNGQEPLEGSEFNRVLHIQDSALAYQSKAQDLLQVSGLKMLGSSLSRKEDRMKEAANLMLKSGNFQDYCDIQMQLGNYEAVIAYAPKVSLKYWQTCIQQYLQYMENLTQDDSNIDKEEEKINYLLLLGKTSEAASLLHQKGQTQEAKLIKTLSINSNFIENPLQRHESKVQNQTFNKIQEVCSSDESLKMFTMAQAQRKFNQNQPILAAAIHLSISDVKRAVQKLILSNNLEYALVVTQLFYPQALDQVLTILFHKCIDMEQMSLAMKIIQKIQNPVLKQILESSYELIEEENDEEPINKKQSHSVNQQGSVKDMLISKNIESACQIAIQLFISNDNKGKLTQEVFESFFLIGQFDLIQISAEVFTSLMECYVCIALLKALYFQQFNMFRILLKVSMTRKSNLYSKLLELQQLPNESLKIIVNELKDSILHANFQELQTFMKQYQPVFDECEELKHCWIFNTLKIEKIFSHIEYSDLTGELIKSREGYMLEEHSKVANVEEALDLALLIPFSPLTVTYRRRLIPY